MKKAFFTAAGVAAFWLSWPYLYVHLKRTSRARVLLTADNRILLVRAWHGRNIWTLPGGGIGKGESPESTAQRELMEETGVAIGTDQLTELVVTTFHERGLSFRCHYFAGELAKIVPARAHLPEIIASEWVSLDRLDDYRLGQDVHQALSARRALLQ